MISKKWRVI